MQVGQFSESLRVASGAPAIEQASVTLPASAPARELPAPSPAASTNTNSQPAVPSVAATQSGDKPKPGKESRRKKRTKQAPPVASADEIARLTPPPTAERSREVDVPQPPQLAMGPAHSEGSTVPQGSIPAPKRDGERGKAPCIAFEARLRVDDTQSKEGVCACQGGQAIPALREGRPGHLRSPCEFPSIKRVLCRMRICYRRHR